MPFAIDGAPFFGALSFSWVGWWLALVWIVPSHSAFAFVHIHTQHPDVDMGNIWAFGIQLHKYEAYIYIYIYFNFNININIQDQD
jgi:hypothetical protein